MKRCPECAAEYGDDRSFCAKDGRALAIKPAARSRLCPHCANSIGEDSPNCPYCKAELASSPAPQWPRRDEEPPNAQRPTRQRRGLSIPSKMFFVVAIIVLGTAVYLIGMQRPPRVSDPAIEQRAAELQQKELTIKEQDRRLRESEQRIRALEKELAEVRQQGADRSGGSANLKRRLDESQRDLAVAQQRLAIANREIERLASNRQAAAKPVAPPDPPPAASAPPPRSADPGVYETLRATPVYDHASAGARVVSRIDKGTRVDVVRSVGEWLEVRSKHGNPSGFIRIDDAVFVRAIN